MNLASSASLVSVIAFPALNSSGDNAESAFGTRYVTGIWHYGDSGTLYAAVIGIEHSKYNKLWGRYSGEKWNYE